MRKFNCIQFSALLLLGLSMPIQGGIAHAQSHSLPSINFRNVVQLRTQVEALKRRVSQLEAQLKQNSAWKAKANKLEASVRFLKLSMDLYIKKMDAYVNKMNNHTHSYSLNRIDWRNLYVNGANGKTLSCSYVFSQKKTPENTSTPR